MELSSLSCGARQLFSPQWASPCAWANSFQQENGREWRYKICLEQGGRSTKEEKGGNRCHPWAPTAPLQRAVMSPHGTCSLPALKGAWDGSQTPTNTLHSGLPRSWRLGSNRCQQAGLAKQDPPSGEEGLIFAFWSHKFWVSHNCLARELTLTSDK